MTQAVTATPAPGSERWAWIELLGFDIGAEDLGVAAVLGRMGFVPDGMSLLLFNADFVHTHGERDPAAPFPTDYCSYCGHLGNEERGVQAWSAALLRRLIQTLQAHGTRVYVSVFDLFVSAEWIGRHPELLAVRRTGERIHSLCPWKRLADGSLYEDFFSRQLVQVLRDYGFDGYHCADGYAHQRLPISEGDFSDDLVGQFVEATGVRLPAEFAAPGAADPARLERRADWIWAQRRTEWIHFYAGRITGFMRKVAAAVHGEKRQMVANSAWTKDPFEALYRYGVNYRANAEAGIDAYIVEAAAGASELDGYEKVSGRRALYPFAAAVLLNHGFLPQTPLLFLNGIKDTTEEWCLLRHTPPLLAAEIHTMSHLFGVAAAGPPKRCVAGPVACLADGLSAAEWARMRADWDTAVEFTPVRILGATLVWSDAAHEAQLADYIATRRWSVHRLLHHLLERGAPVHSVVRLDRLEGVRGPLLVLNAHLFPAAELRRVLDCGEGPLLLIGAGPAPAGVEVFCRDGVAADGLWCAGRGLARQPLPSPEVEESGPDLPTDLATVREPSGGHAMFYYDLPYRRLSAAFLQACADLLGQTAAGVRVLTEREAIRVTAMDDAHGVRRLLIGNDAHWYGKPQIEVGRPIRKLTIRTPFPAVPGRVAGSTFSIRVPGRGMVIVDVE
jgi:hypothetical protein